jgi:hypothetical protein
MTDFKVNVLAAGVMTGVTALFGGIEPAWAGPIVQSKSFTVSATDQGSGSVCCSPSSDSGNFDALNNTSSQSFLRFDTLGGTRALTDVIVKVSPNFETYMRADVSGNCFTDVSGTVCDANATNHSEFSVLIDVGVGIDVGSPQAFDTDTFDSCTADPGAPCNYGKQGSLYPMLSEFSVTINTPADLALFVGAGSYNIVPTLDLTGSYGASIDFQNVAVGGIVPTVGGPDNAWGVSASTDWYGDIEVTYNYREVPQGVPEPTTLFLVGAGLVGLARLRRNGKSVA